MAVIDVVLPISLNAPLIALTVGELVEAMRGVPGVHSVAATQRPPLRGSSDNWGIEIEGRPDVDATTAFRVVTPDYFETMGIPVQSGRGLMESDRSTSASVDAAIPESDRRRRRRCGRVRPHGRERAGAVHGVALGTLAFIAFARLLGSLVYGVAPTDALPLLSAAAVLAAADLLAAWVPARRASRTDPASVLRKS